MPIYPSDLVLVSNNSKTTNDALKIFNNLSESEAKIVADWLKIVRNVVIEAERKARHNRTLR